MPAERQALGHRAWCIGTTARIAAARLALSPLISAMWAMDQALLSARAQVYDKARQANPLRWSRQVRD